ncbi:uncharacterized protein LOC100899976 [Galendromus occidentalis]|uniref:Uncharacterized protein LOC100899976 n=1 Tax=Galendromus occidentalis TaxID=34638 RepID=A0AAJ6QTS3_9ACAR|nr:uncharacterized protein LOC100899976 [Galendromus occidentalis]
MEFLENAMRVFSEGYIQTIDLKRERGLIGIAPSGEKILPSSIRFPLRELRVPAEDLEYVEPDTKVRFKVCYGKKSGYQACEVTPIAQNLRYAQIYGVAEDYCRVLIEDCQSLANVDLQTLKCVVPHHLSLRMGEHCIVAVPWKEPSKANKEKRLPSVHLLELHNSKSEAEASLKRRNESNPRATSPTVFYPNEVLEADSPTAGSSALPDITAVGESETKDLRNSHASPHAGGGIMPPSRDEIEVAYWTGVRDGVRRYQRMMTPYLNAPLPFLRYEPMKQVPPGHVSHHA